MLNKVESFAVEQMDGQYLFFNANRVTIKKNGRLIFKIGLFTIIGTVDAGQYTWCQRGVTQDMLRSNR